MIPIAKPYLTEDEAKLAYETILSGWVTQGPRVSEFEEKFAAYVGSKYAVAVSNCTTALHLALIVAEIKEGDEVICPSMSYIATANAIKYLNAVPIFAEVNDQYNLDVFDVEKKITAKTRAILLVHQIGMPADIDAFRELCDRHNLKLIEDAACAVGSSYKGKKIGSHGNLTCFSFHPRKVITTGDGGMITTDNLDQHNRIKLLRQHAMSINDRERHSSTKIIFEDHLEVGYNYRLTDIQAAVGIKQLEKLDKIISERRLVAAKYNAVFESISCINIPVESEDFFTNFQSYAIYLKPEAPVTRNQFMEKMLEKGISTRRGIMTAHRETAYRDLCKNLNLPESERLADNSVLLPLFYPMTENELNSVIESVKSVLNG